MIRWARWGLVAVAVGAGLAASARWSLLAQDRAAKAPPRAREAAGPRGTIVSVQEALLRPTDLPFAEETSLEVVRLFLARNLGAQVVLDRSALDRLELTPEDTVQLELKNVRLKVGLKLLLDQVGLAFRVEPEDNLLILTDPESSDDPAQRTAAELKSLHRDIHDLQDAVDDLRDLVEDDLGIEPEVTKHHSTIVGLEKQAPPRDRRRNPSPRKGERVRKPPPAPAGVRG
jgi:hypothetical protein